MLREGFLEETWSELSPRGKVRVCQTNKEKRAYRAEGIAWAKTWETKKAVTFGEELVVSLVKISINWDLNPLSLLAAI